MTQKEVYRECQAESGRQLQWFAAIVLKHPEFRRHVAFALLGSAIALADMVGIDVEAWLAELRRREPKPPILVPPS